MNMTATQSRRTLHLKSYEQFCSSSKKSTHLEAKIAYLYEFHLIINVFRPEMLELVQSYVQPRLHVSVEMDDSGIIDMIHANTRIIPKSEDMP